MKVSLLENTTELQYKFGASWSCKTTDDDLIGYIRESDGGRLDIVGNNIRTVCVALFDLIQQHEGPMDLRIVTKQHSFIGDTIRDITKEDNGRVVACVMAINEDNNREEWCIGVIFTDPLLPKVAA